MHVCPCFIITSYASSYTDLLDILLSYPSPSAQQWCHFSNLSNVIFHESLYCIDYCQISSSFSAFFFLILCYLVARTLFIISFNSFSHFFPPDMLFTCLCLHWFALTISCLYCLLYAWLHKTLFFILFSPLTLVL